MKKHLLTILVTLTLSGSAFSQAAWGSVGGLTVALTLSYDAPALVKKDDTGKVLTLALGGGPTFDNTYSVDTMSYKTRLKSAAGALGGVVV
jgi:hypothetical protein